MVDESKFKLFGFLLLFATTILLLTMYLLTGTAHAAETTVTVIPPLDETKVYAFAAAVALALERLLVKLLGPWGWVAKVARVDQIFNGYIRGALVKYFAKNPELTTKGIVVDFGNEWVANLAREILPALPGWMVRFIGGPARIEQMILNRLPAVLRDVVPSLYR